MDEEELVEVVGSRCGLTGSLDRSRVTYGSCQQDGVRRFVKLDPIPVGDPNEPLVLYPVPIWFLRRHKLRKRPLCRRARAEGHEGPRRLDQIP